MLKILTVAMLCALISHEAHAEGGISYPAPDTYLDHSQGPNEDIEHLDRDYWQHQAEERRVESFQLQLSGVRREQDYQDSRRREQEREQYLDQQRREEEQRIDRQRSESESLNQQYR